MSDDWRRRYYKYMIVSEIIIIWALFLSGENVVKCVKLISLKRTYNNLDRRTRYDPDRQRKFTIWLSGHVLQSPSTETCTSSMFAFVLYAKLPTKNYDPEMESSWLEPITYHGASVLASNSSPRVKIGCTIFLSKMTFYNIPYTFYTAHMFQKCSIYLWNYQIR